MGYLSSCKSESAVLISNNTNNKKKKKKKIEEFRYRDLEAATNGFSDHKLLGKGSHGLVYKAVLRNGRQVAVKIPTHHHKQQQQQQQQQANPPRRTEVENEIEILSKIRNPRLVNLLGFTTEEEEEEEDPTTTPAHHRQRLLVVEFMSNGTLYQVLHSSSAALNWGRRIRLALQTAKAIDALHSATPPVIHRDIKSANVLIDRNFNARLGDFGLALRYNTHDFHLLSTPPAGTMGYLDPSYVTPDNLSTKTDVFSFGILLLEIISGRKAIDVNYSPPSIVDWAIPLIRKGKMSGIYDPRIDPPKDPAVRKHLAVIAAKCVRSCRERRPSMKDVVEWLSGISKLVPLHSWNYGFTNPCMVVDTIGRPVGGDSIPLKRNNNNNNNKACKSVAEEEEKEEQENLDGARTKVLRSLRTRVYSDLGLKNNLIDLVMLGAYETTESAQDQTQNTAKTRSSSRFKTTEFATSHFRGDDNTNMCSKGVANSSYPPLL